MLEHFDGVLQLVSQSGDRPIAVGVITHQHDMQKAPVARGGNVVQ